MLRNIGSRGRFYSKLNTRISNNVIFKSLEYVKRVDNQQNQLIQASTQDKIDVLMEKIGKNEELLYMLSLFHYECRKLGIVPENLANRTKSFSFWYNYLFKLTPINNSFWELCALLNISNHNHKLTRNVSDLGLLDPKNFDKLIYHQLQLGKFNGLDFTEIQTTSFTRPSFNSNVDIKDGK